MQLCIFYRGLQGGVGAYNKDGGLGKTAKKSATKRTTTLDANSPKLRNFIVSALKDDGETTLVAEIASGRATLRVNPELVAEFFEKTQKSRRDQPTATALGRLRTKKSDAGIIRSTLRASTR